MYMTTTFPFGAFLGQVTISGVLSCVFKWREAFCFSQESYDHEGNYLDCVINVLSSFDAISTNVRGKTVRILARNSRRNVRQCGKMNWNHFHFLKRRKEMCFVLMVANGDMSLLFLMRMKIFDDYPTKFFNDERDLSFPNSSFWQVISDGDDAFVPLGCMRPSSVVSVPKQHDCLADIRHEIDLIDRNLLELLSRRFCVLLKS